MERAGSILIPAIKRLGIEEDVRLLRIRNDWDALFDKPLSLHMSPSRLLEGELLLNVDSPIWMQQLHFCSREITAKLSSYGVKSVRLRVGKVFQRKCSDNENNKPKGSLSADDARFIDDLVTSVNDEELRAAIKTAAEKFLSCRKKSS